MSKINLIYIIPTLFIILSFAYYLIKGKNSDTKNKVAIKYIPILAIFSLVVSVFSLTNYYENQLEIENAKFNQLQNQKLINDSIYLFNSTRRITLDSLNALNLELQLMLEKVKNQEKVLGQNIELRNKIKEKLEKTNLFIGEIEQYNEIIDVSIFKKNKGTHSVGTTSDFIFFCPKDTTSDYIDLKLFFQDKNLVDKIAYIFITFSYVKNDKEYESLFMQAYKPQIGVNAFKVKNYLKQPKTLLEIGYILKTEQNNDFPKFEKISCKR
jgi:hypothetical protein